MLGTADSRQCWKALETKNNRSRVSHVAIGKYNNLILPIGKVKYESNTINFIQFIIYNLILLKYIDTGPSINPNKMRLSADHASQHQRLFDKTTLSQTR